MPTPWTRRLLRYIPIGLTTLRLILGPVALWIVHVQWPRILLAIVLIAATLTDIYDGVIARRLGIATPALRRYDSFTDLIYYLFILCCAWLLDGAVLRSHWLPISLLVISELSTIMLSIARFGVMPATHTYLAKFYGLCLLACCIGLLAFGASGWIISALAVVGITSNAEITIILLTYTAPPVDVKSLFVLRRQRTVAASLHSSDA